MNPKGRDRPGIKGSALMIAGALIVLIGIAVSTRIAGEEISGKHNSGLMLGGVIAVVLSSWVLWKRGRELDRATWATILALAITGTLAVALVNLELLGETGVIVTVPFLVPLVLALLRMRR
jgi:drug/metabolite transporter (DMT)-like permease